MTGRFLAGGLALDFRDELPGDIADRDFYHRRYFSRDTAYRALSHPEIREMITWAVADQAKREIRSSGLPKREPVEEIRRALADFRRPMMDAGDLVRGNATVRVYLRGKPLSYGRHPLAGVMFSVMDAYEQLDIMANEGVISYDDCARLRAEVLVKGRFAIPDATPNVVTELKRRVLDRGLHTEDDKHEPVLALRIGWLTIGAMRG